MKQLLAELVKLGKTEKFNGELDYGAHIGSEQLFEAMRFVGMEEASRAVIEQFLEDAPTIHQTLLAITFSNFLDSSKCSKKARRALRLLLNICQRSTDFAQKIPFESVELLETLLATQQFNPEIFLLLLKTADGSWLEFQKAKRYSNLLERVVEHSESSAMAYISILVEKDYGFLANCYAEMHPNAFCALLEIVKTLQDYKKDHQIHQNNLLFVLNLLELIVKDYASFRRAKNPKEPIEMLHHLVEIVAEMCSNREMSSALSEKATVICCCVDLLDTVLHGEAMLAEHPGFPEMPPDEPEFAGLRKKIEEERSYQRRAKDRPVQPPPSRIKRVELNESLSELADLILKTYQDVLQMQTVGELKLSLLKAIANVCSVSEGNKGATLSDGRMGLLSVLQCTSRRPEYFMESFAMRNWAIFCVRQMTDNCQANKEVILGLDEPEQPIIDRKRLLKEFGIEESDLENAHC